MRPPYQVRTTATERSSAAAKRRFVAKLTCVLICPLACKNDRAERSSAVASASASRSVSRPRQSAVRYDVLYLPDGGDRPPPEVERPAAEQPVAPPSRCPPEMVSIRGEFCIDRYEAVLEDGRGRRISPYYHPTQAQTRATYEHWLAAPPRTEEASTVQLLAPPSWQLDEQFTPTAVVRRGEIPNGYVSGQIADLACRRAGKRLCTEEEWVTACRGERGTDFPYGSEYEAGRCNVFREAHPAQVLHGNPSIGHLDPRLNLVVVGGQPLLRPTGATSTCGSKWGDDVVMDMVGNLDEWVDDPDGVFLGGFYSRATKEGCAQRVGAHTWEYFDYSLGLRCCR